MATKVQKRAIADGAIGAGQLEANSITGDKIADGAVGAGDIGDGAVGTSELADGAVTAGKMAATLNLSSKTITMPAANTPALTKSNETAPIAFSSGALLTFAHAMGVAPKLLQIELSCVTGELGWIAGDRVVIACGAGSDSAANRGLGVYYDATNIYVRVGSAASPLVLNSKTSGATAAITVANWRLVVRAWA